MASKSWTLSPGSKKDGSENGISSAGTVRDAQDALAASLSFRVNTMPLAYLVVPSPHSRMNGSINPPPASLYRAADAGPCDGSTRLNQAALLAKAPLPLRSVQSERWPTTQFRCHGGAGRDDVPGTVEQ